jgi:hypothetical protein
MGSSEREADPEPAWPPAARSGIDGIVERQIRDAQQRGLFDNLPGAGRPLGDIGERRDENWWLRQYLLREGVTGVPFLPPALALRKEAEDLPAAVAALDTEVKVRAMVARLNARIRDALAKPADGPSMTLMEVDVERLILDWRLFRISHYGTAQQPGTDQDPATESGAARRRRWRLRGR